MAKLAQYKTKLLDEFEARTDDWSFGDFESRLYEIKKDAYYQDAKGIITEAYKDGSWNKTVTQYAISNFISFGNSSLSFFNELFLSLPKEQQEEIKKRVNK